MKQRIYIIAGPTASGKTAAAIGVAKRMNAEIVSADSIQIYRGLDIGSAKPSVQEQCGVPHHLIDCVDIEDRKFQRCNVSGNVPPKKYAKSPLEEKTRLLSEEQAFTSML